MSTWPETSLHTVKPQIQPVTSCTPVCVHIYAKIHRFPGYVHLTQARVIKEEGTSIEKILPQDQAVGGQASRALISD